MAKTNLGRILIIWKGEYLSTTPYDKLDAVGSEGSSYLCISPCTGVALTDTNYWAKIASKGLDGEVHWNNFTEEEKSNIINLIETDVLGVTFTDGFKVVDNQGNIVLQYTQEGFDVALMSSHLIQLLNETLEINSIIMDNTVTSGGVNPVPSSAIYTALQALKSETLQHIVFSCIKTTAEDGFFIVDEAGNIGFEVNNTQIKPSALSFKIVE